MHKFLFYNKFAIRLYIFRTLCAHHQGVKFVLYSICYHQTCRWTSGAQVESGLHSSLNLCTGRPPTGVMIPEYCTIQFWPPEDEHIVPETCRGIEQTYFKTRICALGWLITKITVNVFNCTTRHTLSHTTLSARLSGCDRESATKPPATLS